MQIIACMSKHSIRFDPIRLHAISFHSAYSA